MHLTLFSSSIETTLGNRYVSRFRSLLLRIFLSSLADTSVVTAAAVVAAGLIPAFFATMPTEGADWPSSVDQFPLEKKIGQGAFATVYKAHCPAKGNIPVAIKVMDLENINSSFEDIRQEVQMMRMSDHPNILRCYCSFVHECQLWLVMQMMEKGSCLHVMTQAKRMGMGEGMREDWLAYILRESLQGLKYFHDQGQIHRDVKAGNILLDGQGNVRLADFGVSGWLINSGDRRQTTKTFVGTPCWMAPEVMEQIDGYDYKADIWSFGITALELAKGYAPYAHFAPMKVLIMTIQQEVRVHRWEGEREGQCVSVFSIHLPFFILHPSPSLLHFLSNSFPPFFRRRQALRATQMIDPWTARPSHVGSERS